MAVSRKIIREALQSAMSSYYTVAQAGFAYKPDDLNGVFPAYAVESVSAERSTEKFAAVRNRFEFIIHHFVLYANPAQSWTKQNADDALDSMELAWATFLTEKKSNQANWRDIAVLGPSVILDNVDMGGERYINEQIPIRVEF